MRYKGAVGFMTEIENPPESGIYKPYIVERTYRGDVMSFTKKYENAQQVNDNVNLNVRISIIADPFARRNLANIRYLTFMGSKWKIRDVDVKYPRLILSLDGVYNQ